MPETAQRTVIAAVTVDAAAARRDMEGIEAAARRVRDAAPAAPESPGQALAPKAAPAPAADPGNAPANAAAPRLADLQGRAIGKALVGFLASHAAGTALEYAKDPLTDSSGAAHAQAAVSGALGMGMAGLMAAGPWGAAVGALLGGLTSLAGSMKQTSDRDRAARHDSLRSVADANRNARTASSDEAFQRLLQLTPGRDARISLLERRRMAILGANNGADPLDTGSPGSFQSLSARLERTSPGDRDYAHIQALRDAQLRRANALGLQIARERWSSPLPAPLRGSDTADAYAARGLTVGPRADAARANDRVISLLEKIADRLGRDAAEPVFAL